MRTQYWPAAKRATPRAHLGSKGQAAPYTENELLQHRAALRPSPCREEERPADAARSKFAENLSVLKKISLLKDYVSQLHLHNEDVREVCPVCD